MFRLFILLSLVLAISHTQALAAGDPALGKAKAAVCVACHGATGISPNTQWPNLAGQQEQYLIRQLKAFRDGGRNDPLMTPMAAGLTDEDIANLAAWYHSLK